MVTTKVDDKIKMYKLKSKLLSNKRSHKFQV